MSFSFGKAGIFVGLVCLATLYLIDMYGPGSYSSSGSGVVMADGTVVITRSSQPILPLIARSAFYAFLLPLVFGAVAVFRKERTWPALGSFGFGLAPVLIYTIGIFLTSMLYFAISLPAIALYASGRILDKHNTDE